MSRQSFTKPPKYCFHRGSGQAVVYIQRRPHYLGKYESSESHEGYARIIADWTQRPSAGEVAQQPQCVSVNQLLLANFLSMPSLTMSMPSGSRPASIKA